MRRSRASQARARSGNSVRAPHRKAGTSSPWTSTPNRFTATDRMSEAAVERPGLRPSRAALAGGEQEGAAEGRTAHPRRLHAHERLEQPMDERARGLETLPDHVLAALAPLHPLPGEDERHEGEAPVADVADVEAQAGQGLH